jgi:hypothetical protein
MRQFVIFALFGAVSLALWLLLWPQGSVAAIVANKICAPHQAMAQVLEESYDEEPVNLALDADGNLIEFYRSKNGSWTVVVVSSTGEACVLSSGDAWVTVAPLEDAGTS